MSEGSNKRPSSARTTSIRCRSQMIDDVSFPRAKESDEPSKVKIDYVLQKVVKTIDYDVLKTEIKSILNCYSTISYYNKKSSDIEKKLFF